MKSMGKNMDSTHLSPERAIKILTKSHCDFAGTEIDTEIKKYLKCGIYDYGFARVKCENPDCGEEYLLPFSCKGRGVCPSCIQKFSLDTELRLIDGDILKEVPHRHIILTIPKLLRKNFFWPVAAGYFGTKYLQGTVSVSTIYLG